jgi:hypothetical protein
LVEDGGDVVESIEAFEKPAAEGALDAREGVAAVDEVASADVGIDSFAGGMDGQGIEVVAEDFELLSKLVYERVCLAGVEEAARLG